MPKGIKLTNDLIDARLIKLNKSVLRISDIKNKDVEGKIEWQCIKCKNIWKAKPNDIFALMYVCKNCDIRKILTNEYIDERLKKENKKIKRIGSILNFDWHMKIDWQCQNELEDGTTCNYIWKTKTNHIFHDHSTCPKCSNHLKFTNETIDEKIKNFPFKRITSYIDYNTNLKWECLKCSHIWIATPKNILGINKTGCPKCNFSKGEIELERVCNLLGLESYPEQTFPDLINPKTNRNLYFDRWIPSKNTAIEYNGGYHYKPILFDGEKYISFEMATYRFNEQQYKDQFKIDYCKQKGINLIIIPYWQYDEIEKILRKELG